MGLSYEDAVQCGIGHLHPNAPGKRCQKNPEGDIHSAKEKPATSDEPGPWAFTVGGWTPPSVNTLLKVHWTVAGRMKKDAARRIALEARRADIPKAIGKRRVSMAIAIPNLSRAPDPDNVWKAVLDALTHAGLIIDDEAKWCELGPVTIEKGPKATTIKLERA